MASYQNDLVTYSHDSLFEGPWESRESEIKFSKGVIYIFFCNMVNYLLNEKLIGSDNLFIVHPEAFGIKTNKKTWKLAQEKLINNYESMGFVKNDNNKRRLETKVWNIAKKCIEKNKIKEHLDYHKNEIIIKPENPKIPEISESDSKEIYKRCMNAINSIHIEDKALLLKLYLVACDAMQYVEFKIPKNKQSELLKKLEAIPEIKTFSQDFYNNGTNVIISVNKKYSITPEYITDILNKKLDSNTPLLEISYFAILENGDKICIESNVKHRIVGIVEAEIIYDCEKFLKYISIKLLVEINPVYLKDDIKLDLIYF